VKRIPAFIAFAAVAALWGCGPEQAEMKTDPATVMNPTGSEANLPPQAQGMGAKQQAAGEAASRNMDQMSRQMEAARQAAGGK
jgi:hypothetical protein